MDIVLVMQIEVRKDWAQQWTVVPAVWCISRHSAAKHSKSTNHGTDELKKSGQFLYEPK